MIVPKWLQQLKEQRKIKEQERLIEALRRPENQHRRPAAKFANKIGSR
jgi:phage antirepressor YoqD-like protein